MSARIVVVHDNPNFVAALKRKLLIAGRDVVIFDDSITAFDVLTNSDHTDVLVTKMVFGPGQPHGIALAAAGRMRHRSLKVIFTIDPDDAKYTAYIGNGDVMFLAPVHPDSVVQAVADALDKALGHSG